MDFWPEFLASSWAREFVAGGIGGIAGIFSGYPLDTLRVHQQSSRLCSASAVTMLRNMIRYEGLIALYRGMGAPLASVTFQNAMVFQIYANLSRAIDASDSTQGSPPSYKGVALGGVGAGAIQSFILTPVELLKIQLQLHNSSISPNQQRGHRGPIGVARVIFRQEGIRGMYRGLTITMIRDTPSHGVYFWTYEYMREWIHPNCRANGDENLRTMLVAGGAAGVASWIFCYPFDVVKTRLQGQSELSGIKYRGIVDCFRKSVRNDGYGVLWRGLGTAVNRAFVVNGAIFSAYETSLRWFFNSNGDSDNQLGNST